MTYTEKLNLINLQKEKLEKRLTQLIHKEKTLTSVAKKANRTEEEKRKYKLGGLVLLALSFCNMEEFNDAEILGSLIKSFENNSATARAVYKTIGEKKLYENRHLEKQSASAQGFTQAEILSESKNV